MASHVKSTDKVPDYALESESAGKTLSRRHPKIKDQFEQRRKELEAEIAEAERRQKQSRDPRVAAGIDQHPVPPA